MADPVENLVKEDFIEGKFFKILVEWCRCSVFFRSRSKVYYEVSKISLQEHSIRFFSEQLEKLVIIPFDNVKEIHIGYYGEQE